MGRLAKKSQASLLESLQEAGLLTLDQVKATLFEAQRQAWPVDQTLQRLGFLDACTLEEFKSSQTAVPYVTSHDVPWPQDLKEKWPYALAQHYKTLGLVTSPQAMSLYMVDPHHLGHHQQVKALYPHIQEWRIYGVKEADFHEVIAHYYGESQRLSLAEELARLPHDPSVSMDDYPIQELLLSLLEEARQVGASDIHLHPEEAHVSVRFRLDGVLRQRAVFHGHFYGRLLVCLKIMAQMNMAETRRPQNGRFTQRLDQGPVDFRVSTHPTLHGESVVIRLLDQLKGLVPLKQLGFQHAVAESLHELIQEPEGMILFTGPTGSGKSTTLYALLQELRHSSRALMTLEEPIEYALSGIRQTHVCETSGLNYADGVRSLLRQDPDVLLIGEIRDEETAKMAFRAAMTGHLVLTTLHTLTPLGAVARLQDLAIAPALIADYVKAFVGQRLVRLPCKACGAKGCEACQFTGYAGRQAVAELVRMTPALRAAISEGASLYALETLLKDQGHQTLLDQALALEKEGRLTPLERHRIFGTQGAS